MRNIMYAVDKQTGLVWSRVGSEYAVPVLDYDGMQPENNFATRYALERVSVFEAIGTPLFHTRKIPLRIRNEHRKFWGMKELPVTAKEWLG